MACSAHRIRAAARRGGHLHSRASGAEAMVMIQSGFGMLALELIHSINAQQQWSSLAGIRLADGLFLRSASDGPGALLRADVFAGDRTGLQAALTRLTRAGDLMTSATGAIDAGLDILSQLDDLLATPAPAGSNNSQQVSDLIDQFDAAMRAAGAGQHERLLDGFDAIRFNGANPAIASPIQVLRAPKANVNILVNVTALGSAASLNVGVPPSVIGQAMTLNVTGPLGTAQITVPSTDPNALANAINGVSGQTGAFALVNGGAVTIKSLATGTSATVTVTPVSGAATTLVGAAGMQAAGTNALASCTGGFASTDGNTVKVRFAGASFDFQAVGTGNLSITTTGGGMLINSSPDPDSPYEVRLGLPDCLSSSLGLTGIGTLADLKAGGSLAAGVGSIIEQRSVIASARDSLTRIRSNIAGVQNTFVDSALQQFQDALDAATSAEDRLRNIDPASEALALSQHQLQGEAAAAALAALTSQWRLLLLPLSNLVGF